MDDKVLVIIAVTFITFVAMIQMGTGADAIINSALSGLFGIAVGKSL